MKVTQIKKHLSNALKLCRQHDIEWVITDWLEDQELAEGYGYTTDLNEEIAYLKSELKDRDTLHTVPPFTQLIDDMKFEFFLENFNKFTLEDLENIVTK